MCAGLDTQQPGAASYDVARSSLADFSSACSIVLRKTVSRGKLLSVIAQCPPCLIGLEACSGAHYWAREFEKLGHEVRIIAVKFIDVAAQRVVSGIQIATRGDLGLSRG